MQNGNQIFDLVKIWFLSKMLGQAISGEESWSVHWRCRLHGSVVAQMHLFVSGSRLWINAWLAHVATMSAWFSSQMQQDIFMVPFIGSFRSSSVALTHRRGPNSLMYHFGCLYISVTISDLQRTVIPQHTLYINTWLTISGNKCFFRFHHQFSIEFNSFDLSSWTALYVYHFWRPPIWSTMSGPQRTPTPQHNPATLYIIWLSMSGKKNSRVSSCPRHGITVMDDKTRILWGHHHGDVLPGRRKLELNGPGYGARWRSSPPGTERAAEAARQTPPASQGGLEGLRPSRRS